MKKIFTAFMVLAFMVVTAPMSFAVTPLDQSACGNFNISTFAIGGGIDSGGSTIANGTASGTGLAGGASSGNASGGFVSLNNTNLGEAEGSLSSTAGGFSTHESGSFNPTGDNNVGIYSNTQTYSITGGSLHLGTIGYAYAGGIIAGTAGQSSLDRSTITSKSNWISYAFTSGIAGQQSTGTFLGNGNVIGEGNVDVESSIEMQGQSHSESYRGVDNKTEYMGTNISANTLINTSGFVDHRLSGSANLEGGYITSGKISAATIQTTNNGFASATSNGCYKGSGSLGTNFNGGAQGYTYTSATQIAGGNGSVMQSASGMRVFSSAITP